MNLSIYTGQHGRVHCGYKVLIYSSKGKLARFQGQITIFILYVNIYNTQVVSYIIITIIITL